MALDTYTTLTRRLLSDPSGNIWQAQEITDDINAGRVRVAQDTKALRQLVTGVPLVANQELYNIATTINTGTPAGLGLRVCEVVSVTIYWSSMRVICQNRAFTEQSAKLRIWQSYQSRPGSLAKMGANNVYINPTPDQPYLSDWDVVVVPAPLVLVQDPEVLPVPFQWPVQFYAASIAKFSQQSYKESDILYHTYIRERTAAMWAFFSARVRDAYRR